MRAALLLSVALAFACGGGGSSATPIQVNIGSTGLSTTSIAANSGGQVKFVNQDTVNHQIASTSCSELSSPSLAPNASFTAMMGQGPKSCSFNDALNPSATQFQGTVTVAARGGGTGGGGGGY
jgi:hypothetical protein